MGQDWQPPADADKTIRWSGSVGAGQRSIGLGIADQDLPAPPKARSALAAAMQTGVLRYRVQGAGALEAVQGWYGDRHGIELESNCIVVLPLGAKPAMSVVADALDPARRNLITFSPQYPAIAKVASSGGRTVLEVALGPDGDIAPDELRDAIVRAAEPGTAGVLAICHPHNPTGRVWTTDHLDAVEAAAVGCGLSVISDELHSDLVYRREGFRSWATRSATPWVVLNSTGKPFNLSGLDTCYAVCSDVGVRRGVDEALSAHGHHTGSLTGEAAIEHCYREERAWLTTRLDTLEQNVRRLVAGLDGTRLTAVIPDAGFLVWIDGRAWTTELGAVLHDRAGLSAMDGARFGAGGKGWARINLAIEPETLTEVIDRLHGLERSL